MRGSRPAGPTSAASRRRGPVGEPRPARSTSGGAPSPAHRPPVRPTREARQAPDRTRMGDAHQPVPPSARPRPAPLVAPVSLIAGAGPWVTRVLWLPGLGSRPSALGPRPSALGPRTATSPVRRAHGARPGSRSRTGCTAAGPAARANATVRPAALDPTAQDLARSTRGRPPSVTPQPTTRQTARPPGAASSPPGSPQAARSQRQATADSPEPHPGRGRPRSVTPLPAASRWPAPSPRSTRSSRRG